VISLVAIMIRVRFELTTHGLEDRCSIQLSYRTVILRRNKLSILDQDKLSNIFRKKLLFFLVVDCKIKLNTVPIQ
jgi:hypothetical protein